jgi:hypothetical protein
MQLLCHAPGGPPAQGLLTIEPKSSVLRHRASNHKAPEALRAPTFLLLRVLGEGGARGVSPRLQSSTIAVAERDRVPGTPTLVRTLRQHRVAAFAHGHAKAADQVFASEMGGPWHLLERRPARTRQGATRRGTPDAVAFAVANLQLHHACRDRSCPSRTAASRCPADPARTSSTAGLVPSSRECLAKTEHFTLVATVASPRVRGVVAVFAASAAFHEARAPPLPRGRRVGVPL